MFLFHGRAADIAAAMAGTQQTECDLGARAHALPQGDAREHGIYYKAPWHGDEVMIGDCRQIHGALGLSAY